MSPEGEGIKPHDEDEAVDNEDLTWIRLKAAKFQRRNNDEEG
jgi:hypothetical protein